MTRRTLVLVIATIIFSVIPVAAHDEFRIIGTITQLKGSQLQVKAKDGKVVSVKLDSQTYIHRDKEKEKVNTTELKAGRSVVVDALGDTIADLLAVEIRIVPAIASSPAKK
jgi:hypothetical protein